jgi:hypothetical protein
LDGASNPLRLNEDAPTMMAMVPEAIAEVVGTYGTLERWVISINTDRMLLPFFFGQNLPLEVELPRRVG